MEDCLSGAVALTKNADINKYNNFAYGIGFDRKRFFETLVLELVKM